MKIEYICRKGAKPVNEDDYLAHQNIFAVFDGATGLTKCKDKTGKTGGQIAVEIAKQAFARYSNQGLLKACKTANQYIRQAQIKAKINTNQREALWNTDAAVIKINKDSVDYLNIGHSLILIQYKNKKIRIIRQTKYPDKKALIKWQEGVKKGIKTHDELYEYVRPLLIRDRKKVGQKKKDAALNGDKSVERFAQTGSIPINKLETIILMTDGFIPPKKDPTKDDDFQALLRLYKKSGLKGIVKQNKTNQEKDSECIKYPRFSKRDDTAAIAIRFS